MGLAIVETVFRSIITFICLIFGADIPNFDD